MKSLLLSLLPLLILAGCRSTPTPEPPAVKSGHLILYVQAQRLHVRRGDVDQTLPELGTLPSPEAATLAPDGKQVLALVQDGNEAYLKSYTLSDGHVQAIRLNEAPGPRVAWAPGAQYVAYAAGGDAVVVLDREGRAEQFSVQGGQNVWLRWGPQGHLLVTSGEKLWRWRPGEGVHSVTPGGLIEPGQDPWGPDGTALAYVARQPSGASSLIAAHEDRAAVLHTMPAGSTVANPQWSEGGGLLSAKTITPAASGANQWGLAIVTPEGERVQNWQAPAYPCYIYGFWWLRQERLLVQIAGPDCGAMLVLDGRTGTELQRIAAPLKGLVHLAPARDWIAVENRVSPFGTTLIPLGRPEAQTTLPINGLIGWLPESPQW